MAETPAAGWRRPARSSRWPISQSARRSTFAPPSDDYQTKVIEDWAKEKGVEVEVTRETGADVEKKLQAAIESKQLPDISQMDDGRYTRFFASGLLTDVSDMFAEFGKQWGSWYEPAQKLATKQGKQFLLPYSIDSSLLLYRNDVLQEAGIKRLRATELAVIDDPTAKAVAISRYGGHAPRAPSPSPPAGEGRRGQRGGVRGGSKVHKPELDEMGIAVWHEVAPHRPEGKRDGPRKPDLDEMGPGRESKPYRPGPRSTTGRPGMRGGWKPRGR